MTGDIYEKYKIYIKKELITMCGKTAAENIIELANKHYTECKVLCRDASKGEVMHLENTIIPMTSFYKALLEVDSENALLNTKTILINLCEKGGKTLNSILKLPGMKSGFMKLMPKMAVKLFGRECGFDYENLRVSNNCIQMDMMVCPYLKYANAFNVPELMHIFCESDFATYGNLTGITFERTETLGTGGTKCDFKFFKKHR